MQESIAKIRSALDRHEMIIIAAECEVWYFGKVESYLAQGDRLIIIKQDRTLLLIGIFCA